MKRFITTLMFTLAISVAAPALAALTLAPAPAAAAPKDNGRLAELRERFKERDPQVQRLKRDNVIGETSEGYLDFVESKSKDAAEVVADENNDRRELYTILAEQEGVEVDVVATRNARRNFERAKKGESLKENGKWRTK